ncbi:MAG: hypothetical protein Q9217_007023, partial [Psora testacea]
CIMSGPTERERNVQREAKRRRAEGLKGTNVVPLHQQHDESSDEEDSSERDSKRRKHNLRDMPNKSYNLPTQNTDTEASSRPVSQEQEKERARAERKSIEADAARLLVQAAHDSDASDDALEAFQEELQKKMSARAKPSIVINPTPQHMAGLMPPEEEARTSGVVKLNYSKTPVEDAAGTGQQITPPQSVQSRNASLPQDEGHAVGAVSTFTVARQLEKPESSAPEVTNKSTTISQFQATNTHLQIRLSGKPGFRPLLLNDCLATPSFLDNIIGAWRLTEDKVSEMHLIYDWLAHNDPSRHLVLRAEELGQMKDLLIDDILELKCWEHRPGCVIQVQMVTK